MTGNINGPDEEGKMKTSFFASLILFMLIATVGSGSSLQAAESYPVKPITCIIPIEAGGDADINARPLMEKASAILGKPIIIVNKPGGGHTIGYREVFQAKPDGYTIGIGALTIVMSKLQGLFPYDYRDFTLMGSFTAQYPMIVASTKTQRPFATIQEAFSFAKSHPGEVSWATTSVGGPYWAGALLVAESTGLKFNIIPQAGSGAFVVTQVAGGHCDIGVTGAPSAKPHIDAGNIRPLAVLAGSRLPGQYNYVPTLKENGHDVSINSYISAIGPPKMPKAIVEKLVKTFEIAANSTEYHKFIVSRNDAPHYMGPEKFFIFCDEQRKMYKPTFEKAGLFKEK